MPRSGPRSRTSSRGSGPAGRWPSPAVAALTAPGWPPPASWSPPASTLETRSTGSMPRGAVPSHTRSNSPTCGPGAGRKGRRRACWVRPEPARSVAASARTTFEFAHGELEDRGGHADRILEPHRRARGGQKPRFVLGQSRYDRPMWYLVYLVVRALVRLLVGGGRPDRDGGAKDLEILVLRHQLRVLHRTAGRPQLRTVDRVLLATASRAIPRDRWVAFLVTPSTLLGSETRIRSRGGTVVFMDEPAE